MVLSECWLAYLVQVGTHIALLPGLLVCVWLRQFGLAGLGVCTALTSLLYHVCEVLASPACVSRMTAAAPPTLLGMNDGKWHRLDNVFAIVSLQHMCLHLSHLPAGLRSALDWAMVALTLWCQEIAPWDLRFTLLPIAPALLTLVIALLTLRPALHRTYLVAALAALLPAVVCFAKGLDDTRDYLRMWHGGWHVCMSATVSFLLLSKEATHHHPHGSTVHDKQIKQE